MNIWINKSIDLANKHGYLDKLFSVYPTELGDNRGLSEGIKKHIEKAFKNKNEVGLIKELLKLPKFPINDPYISSLRKYPFLLDKNPRTIKRIGKRLISMDVDVVLELSIQPKSPSRQLGHSFRNWLTSAGYPFLGENDFKKYKGVAFLSGGDTKLKNFANKELKVKNLKKGLDFILKVKDKFILGEAKFLTDYGGTQNNQFNDAIRISKIKNNKVIGIAILDGIVWFDSGNYMSRKVRKINNIALSSLLLKDYIKSLSKKKILE